MASCWVVQLLRNDSEVGLISNFFRGPDEQMRRGLRSGADQQTVLTRLPLHTYEDYSDITLLFQNRCQLKCLDVPNPHQTRVVVTATSHVEVARTELNIRNSTTSQLDKSLNFLGLIRRYKQDVACPNGKVNGAIQLEVHNFAPVYMGDSKTFANRKFPGTDVITLWMPSAQIDDCRRAVPKSTLQRQSGCSREKTYDKALVIEVHSRNSESGAHVKD
ncbi:hypothetical protein B566_EDAN010497 [Ephemera danica]|nr:hypothetical protein B566_EDAN010497 [Ephemera danica]